MRVVNVPEKKNRRVELEIELQGEMWIMGGPRGD